MDEINKIMSMAVANIDKVPFVCKYCSNTGQLEIIVYEGNQITGFSIQPGQEVLGYSRFFRACWGVYQYANSQLCSIDNLNYSRESLKQLEIAKSKLSYDPHNYYRVKGMVDCTHCKTSTWRK